MGSRYEIKRDPLVALDERELQIVGLINYYGFSGTDLAPYYRVSKNMIYEINRQAIKKIKAIYEHREFKNAGGCFS